MKKILITCYAVNPYKGSEDGTGWNMICQIARYQKAIAITRKNNKEDIEKYMQENDFPGKENITFHYFDWPYYLRFWKRKNKGALLYFYLWQMTIVRFIRKQKITFDIAHNLNFHSDWTPTFLWRLNKPLVWGPVGHHPLYPGEYIKRSYGSTTFFIDRIKWMAKKMFWKADPFLAIGVNNASRIIGINSSVSGVLKIPKDKVVILPAVGAKPPEESDVFQSENFEILSVGRFVPLKGFDLTIKAFARFYRALPPRMQHKTRLTLVGKGPCEEQMKTLITEKGLQKVVRIIPWIKQAELMEIYRTSSLFFFPSHEGAGMVVPEALAFGLPVLCLDNYGPGEFINDTCGRKVPYGKYENTVDQFTEYLHEFFINKTLLEQLSKGAKKHFENYFTWDRKGIFFRDIYEEVIKENGAIERSLIPQEREN